MWEWKREEMYCDILCQPLDCGWEYLPLAKFFLQKMEYDHVNGTLVGWIVPDEFDAMHQLAIQTWQEETGNHWDPEFHVIWMPDCCYLSPVFITKEIENGFTYIVSNGKPFFDLANDYGSSSGKLRSGNPLSQKTRGREYNKLSASTKLKVLKRDRFTCTYCGITGADAELHVDHVIPLSKGGSNNIYNLTTACSSCNLRKSNKVIRR